ASAHSWEASPTTSSSTPGVLSWASRRARDGRKQGTGPRPPVSRRRRRTRSGTTTFEVTVQPSKKGALVATATRNHSRTAHLIELMTKGDEAFNARDGEGVDAVHPPDMIAYIPGLAQPIYGSEAHSAA